MDNSIGNNRTMMPEGDGNSASFPPGTVLGHYRILSLLGRGGMGEVYKVKHETLTSFHALKVVLRQYSSVPGFAERFLAESRIMGKLSHPNIVHCTDAGVYDGINYLVMDFIEGPYGELLDLGRLLAQRRQAGELLDEEEAVAVGLQICEGLAYAHSYRDVDVPNGIVHRDLKPANILIGADTQLLITDFGLARLMGPDFERSVIEQSMPQGLSVGEMRTRGSESLGDQATDGGTSSSGVVGTYAYMSPEQREGRPVDCRSDVYAMGVILYELLTGRQVVGALKPPRSVRPDLSPAWDSILLEGCLAYEPKERFASARELVRAMEGISSRSLSQPTQRASTEALIPSRNRHHKGAWISVILISVLFIGLISIWPITRRRVQHLSADVSKSANSIRTPPIAPPPYTYSKPTEAGNIIENDMIQCRRRISENQPSASYLEGVWQEHWRIWQREAEDGEPAAQYLYGRALELGFGPRKNITEAMRLYHQAADRDLALAQYTLGHNYELGEITSKDEKQARYWFGKASDAGLACAKYRLTRLLRENRADGASDVQQEVLRLLEEAAYSGYGPAQAFLGALYFDGEDVDCSPDEAFEWLRRAAHNGDAVAQQVVGNCYYFGNGVQEDAEKAFEWTKMAAENGNVKAQHDLAVMYLRGEGVPKDTVESLRWFRMAADAGDPEAQYNTGQAYFFGHDATQRDPKQAARYYLKAAEQGYSAAMRQVAVCYFFGIGFQKNTSTALDWLAQGAEAGDAQAQLYLGAFYLNGELVSRDYGKARNWLEKAESQNVEEAALILSAYPWKADYRVNIQFGK